MASGAGPFSRLAHWVAVRAGHPVAFTLAILVIVAWALLGPLFHYSDSWQLVINTGTTIVTFLMVFLIQNSQTRDTEALQIKVDELVRSHPLAHNELLDLEELSDKELDRIRQTYEGMAEKARTMRRRRASRRRARSDKGSKPGK